MDIVIYAILAIVASGYALLLNTPKGKIFTTANTWATVVFGTLLVLAASWFLIPQEAWLKVFIAFIVSGIPMIARSFINKKKPAPPTKTPNRFTDLEI